MVERDLQSFKDMRACLRLGEIILSATGNHLVTVIGEAQEHLPKVHHARAAVVERQHHGCEGRLHLCVLVDVVEEYLGYDTSLQLDNDTNALTAGFVADVRDAIQDLGLCESDEMLDHLGFVYCIGYLSDNDARLVSLIVNVSPATKPHMAASRPVHLRDRCGSADDPAGREVGPLHVLH